MAQFARPASDISDGVWVNQAGVNTDLFQSIDEIIADDLDFIEAPNGPIDAACTLGLSTVGDPAVSTGHIARYRYARTSGGGSSSHSITVRLMQGGSLIAEWVHSGIGTNFATNAQAQTLTGPQADSITDYSDLELQLIADNDASGAARDVMVSWFELEVPDAAGGGPEAKAGSDTPTVSVSEASSIASDATGSDTPTLSAAESAVLLAASEVADTVALGLTEEASVEVQAETTPIADSDTVAVGLIESADVVQFQDIAASDAVSMGLIETAEVFESRSIEASDTISIGLTESATVVEPPPPEPDPIGLVHRFTSEDDSVESVLPVLDSHPMGLVGNFQGSEIAPGGYDAASGEISHDEYAANPDLYVFGTKWKVERDGAVIWSGTLDDPDDSGPTVILKGLGSATEAERNFERALWLSLEMDWSIADSDPFEYDVDAKQIEAKGDEGRELRFIVRRNTQFLRATGETRLDGAVDKDDETIEVLVNAGGLSAGETIHIGNEHKTVAGSYTPGSTTIPLTNPLNENHADNTKVYWHANNNPDQWATGLVRWTPTSDIRGVMFTAVPSRATPSYDIQVLSAPSLNDALTVRGTFGLTSGDLTGGKREIDCNIPAGNHLVMVRLRRQSQEKKARRFTLRCKAPAIRGLASDDDYKTHEVANDLMAKVAPTWDRTAVQVSTSRVGPLDTEGEAAATILDDLGALDDWRWLALDEEWEWGPWDTRTWVLTEAKFPHPLVPLDRFNGIEIPFRYGGGYVSSKTVMAATYIPGTPERIHRIELDRPPPEDIATVFAQHIADYLWTVRKGGTAEFTWVEAEGFPGLEVDGWQVHAGDTLLVPTSTNLLTANGSSFETDTSTVAPAGTDPPTVTHDAALFLYGSKSVEVSFPAAGSAFLDSNASFGPDVTVPDGATRTFSAWLYGLPANITPLITGSIGAGNLVLVEGTQAGWGRYALTWTNNTGTSQNLQLYLYKNAGGAGVVNVDALQVEDKAHATPWRMGATFHPLRITSKSFTDTSVQVSFDDSHPLLRKLEARRTRALALGKGQAQATLGGLGLERPKTPEGIEITFDFEKTRKQGRRYDAIVDWEEVTRDIEEQATAISSYEGEYRYVKPDGTKSRRKPFRVKAQGDDDDPNDPIPTRARIRDLDHPHSWQIEIRLWAVDALGKESAPSVWSAPVKPANWTPPAPTGATLVLNRKKLELEFDLDDPDDDEDDDGTPVIDRDVAYVKCKRFVNTGSGFTQVGKTLKLFGTGKTWAVRKPRGKTFKVQLWSVGDHGNTSTMVEVNATRKKPAKPTVRSRRRSPRRIEWVMNPPTTWHDGTSDDFDQDSVEAYDYTVLHNGVVDEDRSDHHRKSLNFSIEIPKNSTGWKLVANSKGVDGEDSDTETEATTIDDEPLVVGAGDIEDQALPSSKLTHGTFVNYVDDPSLELWIDGERETWELSAPVSGTGEVEIRAPLSGDAFSGSKVLAFGVVGAGFSIFMPQAINSNVFPCRAGDEFIVRAFIRKEVNDEPGSPVEARIGLILFNVSMTNLGFVSVNTLIDTTAWTEVRKRLTVSGSTVAFAQAVVLRQKQVGDPPFEVEDVLLVDNVAIHPIVNPAARLFDGLMARRSTDLNHVNDGFWQQVIFPSVAAPGAIIPSWYDTTTGLITVPYTGVWHVDASVTFVANNTGRRELRFFNVTTTTEYAIGQQLAPANTRQSTVFFSKRLLLTAGHQYRVQAFQNSGGNLNMPGDVEVTFNMEFQGSPL